MTRFPGAWVEGTYYDDFSRGVVYVRYAASDVGTNSCRLLIADIDSQGMMSVLQKEVVTTRIGEGLARSGWLTPEAINRTLNCLEIFLEIMRKWQVSERVVVATSAVREALNRADFLFLAEERTGLPIRVLNGEEEGQLSYLGARKALRLKGNPIVIDVGGGSTEIIYQRRGIKTVSIPVGAVRAFEAHWDETEIMNRLAANIPSRLGAKSSPLVVVGGAATTLVAVKKRLERYDPREVQGEELGRLEVLELHHLLENLTLEERRSLPGLQPERADIIVSGLLIIKCLLELIGRDRFIVSDSDLLDGLVWSLHGRSGDGRTAVWVQDI